MSHLFKASVLTGAMLCAAVSTATAQTATSQINATASVLASLQITAGTDLDFGLVVQGVAKSVSVAGPAAGTTSGKFSILGQASQPVSLTFNVPTNLTSGANSMPVSFTGVHNTTNSASGGLSFVPSAGVSSTPLSGTGNLYVFLGGTVTPGGSQAAGSYSGVIQMTVAYVGY